MSVYRIYVEKKPEYNGAAGALLHELTHIFGIKSLTGLRILNRYDAEGLDEAYISQAVRVVFSEPQVDNTYSELPDDYDYIIGVESLPGQFDQRADSCAQCLQMLCGGERPLVRSASIYLLKGALTGEEIDVIRHHLINPVESMEATMEIPETLLADNPAPQNVGLLSAFLLLEDKDLPSFCTRHGLAMDKEDLAFCREYFKKEGRNPTLTELRVIDTYWSDHCRHTTFLTHLTDIRIEDECVKESYDTFLRYRSVFDRKKPVTLMEIATVGAKALGRAGKLEALDKSEEVNACSVKITVDEDGTGQDWLLMFKNETHNHPTEIEPFGGAATCIGGAIRDPLSGRSYVYQAMRITGSGDPTVPVSDTLPGKLPQRVITTKAAHGYSSYGNQIGLATGLVKEIYHPGYIAKRMEVGAVIGAAPAKNVIRQKPMPGDVVILLGGRTGRDGCGGATGSSKSHDTKSLTACGSEVQKGNAPEERKLQRLFRNSEVTRLIKRCNDFGAGGVAVAVGELAEGLEIELDAVPKKYSGLDGTELAISESQERMAVVIAADDVSAFIAHAGDENLEATIIAKVTEAPRLVMKWGGRIIVNISREFLDTNGAPKSASVTVEKSSGYRTNKTTEVTEIGQQTESLNRLERFFAGIVTDLNVCSQKGLTETFDSTIGAATVLMPLGGRHQMTPAQVMAAKLPVGDAYTETCSLMTYAFYPDISTANPYTGAYLAVAVSAAKIVAAGGSLSRCWLTFQEYFERLGSDPKRWGKPFSALLGAFQAQHDLGIAAIGGKDSMSGTFEDIDVPPTLISFAVSTAKADNIISGEFKNAGSRVAIFKPLYRENGIPEIESLKEILSTIEKLIGDKRVLAAYVAETGGIGEAIFKMAAGNRIGFEFDDAYKNTDLLSDYCVGSIVIEMTAACEIPACAAFLGKTIPEFRIIMNGDPADCGKLQEMFEMRLESVFPTRTQSENRTVEQSPFLPEPGIKATPLRSPVIKGKPRVLIPVFPGTNCEYDTAKAFALAGAEPEIMVVKNLLPTDIEWSVTALSEAVSRSQIIALPGGFSGGDEPDGSGKFIVSLFRNPRLKDAVHDLIKNRDGLMCGICNGFQALIKLGLVPYGEITDTDENSPTLTFNTVGRHQSMLVHTRIVSNKSPWLSGANPGDVHTVAISHGEGRFVAPAALIEELNKKGQIATQYADFDGRPSMDIRFNPNGSMFAIEGITSPDGRIFGKMGHSERMAEGLYKNVPIMKNPGQHSCTRDMFKSAVEYFTF